MSYAADLPHATLRWAGTTAEIELSGEVDVAFADQLKGKLTLALRTCPEVLIFDLARVSFLDSTCVAFLVNAHHRALRAGTRMAVIPPTGPARQTLDLCGIGHILSFVDEAASLQSTATAA
jgi:anti-sigma B factor antagonist